MNMTEPSHFTPAGLRGKLQLDEPMSAHVSWRAGGRAERCYTPADMQDLAAFLATCEGPVYFVGLGSNLLVRDGGLKGTVILLHGALNQISLTDTGLIYAEAGVSSPKVASFAAQKNYEGAEFLSGIPGTVGGALAMNAGCYGSETWQYVERVLTIDGQGNCMSVSHAITKSATGTSRFTLHFSPFRPRNGSSPPGSALRQAMAKPQS